MGFNCRDVLFEYKCNRDFADYFDETMKSYCESLVQTYKLYDPIGIKTYININPVINGKTR